jgi:hypothetical protein
MRYVNRFFNTIIAIQNFLEKFENWYLGKIKYLSWVYILSIILAYVLIVCKQVAIGEIVFILGMVLTGVESIIGWKHSVRRWLKICVIYNLIFSTILAYLIQRQIKYAILTPLFIALYLFVWVFLSLISNSKVALLVNEIVSGIAATIFTIGTYLINMALKGLQASGDYKLYYHTDETVMQALENGETLAWKFMGITVLEKLEVAFLSFLPVIGVTALCIIMIKIKIYWMEKNKKSEPEKEIGLSNEEAASV